MENISFFFNDKKIKVFALDMIVLLVGTLPPFIILFLFSAGNAFAVTYAIYRCASLNCRREFVLTTADLSLVKYFAPWHLYMFATWSDLGSAFIASSE